MYAQKFFFNFLKSCLKGTKGLRNLIKKRTKVSWKILRVGGQNPPRRMRNLYARFARDTVRLQKFSYFFKSFIPNFRKFCYEKSCMHAPLIIMNRAPKGNVCMKCNIFQDKTCENRSMIWGETLILLVFFYYIPCVQEVVTHFI